MSKFSNPFTKNPFGTTNSALFDPSKSDTSVITNQPIATQNLMSAQQSSLNFPKSQAQRDFETRRLLFGNRISDENLDSKQKKKNWWNKKTKLQKGLIVGGGVVVIVSTIYLLLNSLKE